MRKEFVEEKDQIDIELEEREKLSTYERMNDCYYRQTVCIDSNAGTLDECDEELVTCLEEIKDFEFAI